MAQIGLYLRNEDRRHQKRYVGKSGDVSTPTGAQQRQALWAHLLSTGLFTIYFQILVTRGAGDDGEAVPGII